jgi:DNA-binding MarR family transcriptional regulator
MESLPLEAVYIYQLERATRQLKRHFSRLLASAYPELQITSDQWIILKRISEGVSLSQREVARITFKDPASITRTIALLEQKGWIVRADASSDRRVYELALTPAGADIVQKILPLAVQVRADGLRGLSPEEIGQFQRVLQAIYENVS